MTLSLGHADARRVLEKRRLHIANDNMTNGDVSGRGWGQPDEDMKAGPGLDDMSRDANFGVHEHIQYVRQLAPVCGRMRPQRSTERSRGHVLRVLARQFCEARRLQLVANRLGEKASLLPRAGGRRAQRRPATRHEYRM